jgi:zona occludens toxin
MLTLVTGVPGAGKTLNTLRNVHKETKDTDRKVFVAGVADLNLGNFQSISYDQAKAWRDLPKGSVLVVDEADQFAPTRGNRGDPPEYVRELARHRHYGLDIFFITQRPKMLDHHLRGLVGRHLHYERAFNRNSSRVLSWESAVDDTGDFHARKLAVVSRVSFDRDYFGVYKSAEVHTHKPRLPAKVWLVAAGLLLCVGLGVRLILDIQGRSEEVIAQAQADQEAPFSESLARLEREASRLTDADGNQFLDQETYLDIRKPRIKDLPYSAPMYDEVLQVQTYPRPQCIYSHRTARCQCYTQQATPIEITYEVCRDIVSNGWFNPYRDESPQQIAAAQRGGTSEAVAHAAPTDHPSRPSVVYPDGNLNAPPVLQVEDQLLSDSINQPGRAYRNPEGSMPLAPSMPRFGSPRSTF